MKEKKTGFYYTDMRLHIFLHFWDFELYTKSAE